MPIDANEHSGSNQADATRLALQCLAEHLLAGDLYRATGRIGLRRTPGGFGQPEHLVDGTRRRLRIDGADLVVLDGDDERWEELSTPVAAATFARTRLGAPDEVFTPETELRPEEPLRIDPGAAGALASFFELVDAALDELRRRHAPRSPSIAQLWPEHFDLAFSMSELNVGGSPGDRDHPEPYLYVGPWRAVDGEMWNESWGMSLAAAEVATAADAVAFFETGIAAALEGRCPS